MKKIIFFLFFINILTFSKNITFHFNTENGKIYFYNLKDLKVCNASFYDSKITLDLKDEVYNFIFMSPNYPRINKDIDINSSSKDIKINFSNKNMVMINGFLHSGDLGLGGTTIHFVNSQNIGYDFKSDIFGNFKAYLKKGKYLISTNRFDYELDPKNEIIYNFNNTKIPYKVDVNLVPIQSFISGRAVDTLGNSIKYPKIYLKTQNKIIEIIGNEYGMFKFKSIPGMLTIMAQKDGYIENGKVINLDKNSSITNIEIPLTRVRASISGIVTDGISPLRYVKIILHDSDFNKIKVIKTDENGFYEFYKIPSKSNVFMTVMKGNKMLYKTNNFPLLDDIENFNLIID